jgi:hypothetical protein
VSGKRNRRNRRNTAPAEFSLTRRGFHRMLTRSDATADYGTAYVKVNGRMLPCLVNKGDVVAVARTWRELAAIIFEGA